MEIAENMSKATREVLIKLVVNSLNKDPEKNLEKLFDIIEKTIKDPYSLNQVKDVHKYYDESPSIREYINNILKTTNKKCLEKAFVNFLVNATWYGGPIREKYMKEENTHIPFVILISPSMRCNLRCTGCYAANYSKKDDIPIEEVDRIVEEAKALGVYFFIILGGEPFFVKDMLKIYKKHNDCIFVPFTNGTLFDKELVDKIASLGNVVPMLSLEGFEKETDARRGKGIFKKVMDSMDLLRERGILFGVSSATSRINMDVVSSDEFVDLLIKKGAKISWYFLFMPVGDKPDVNLMLTPEQRVELGKRIRRIRSEKPYFAIDFFNDAPFVGGCIAGKDYCHINSKEDVEPCIFAHFSTYNLKEKPLIGAFRSQFFKELRSRQPYNKNLLMPCMMIDNPDVVREVMSKVGAKPSDKGADMMLHDEDFHSKLQGVANGYRPYADKTWHEVFPDKANSAKASGQ